MLRTIHRGMCRCAFGHGHVFKSFQMQRVTHIQNRQQMSGKARNQIKRSKVAVNSGNIARAVSWKLREDVLKQAKFQGSVFTVNMIENIENGLPLLQTLQSMDNSIEQQAFLNNISMDDLRAMLETTSSPPDFLLPMIEMMLEVRISDLQIEDFLYIMDFLYMKDYKLIKSITPILRSLYMRWERIDWTVHNLVQLMFYASLHRSAPTEFLAKVEDYIANRIGELDIGEICLFCHCFFSCNRSIRNRDVLQNIAKKVLQDPKNVHLYLISNVLKAFRHANYSDVKFYEQLGDKLIKSGNIYRSNISSLIHIASAYASVHISHERLFSKIYKRAISLSGQSNVRPKDWVKLLWAAVILNYQEPNKICELLLQSMRTNPHYSQNYPEIFVEGLFSLAIKGVYPIDLLEQVLSPQALEQRRRMALEQTHQYLLIDTAVAIEFPQYKGPRLPDEYKSHVRGEDSQWSDLCKQLLRRQGLATIWITLMNILGTNNVNCRFQLNFSFIPGLEMVIDGDQVQPVWIPDERELEVIHKYEHKVNQAYKESNSSLLDTMIKERNKRPVPQNAHLLPMKTQASRRKLVVKVHSWNQYLQNAPVLLGLHAAEHRLLTHCGYEVLTINPHQASAVDGMNLEQRLQFVNDHIIKKLQIKTPH